MADIILASQSPRRKQLLEWAEVPFDVIVKETDESYPSTLAPQEIAIHIAKNKAAAIAAYVALNKTVIAADTIVVLGNEIIGKPKSIEDAVDIISRLQNNKHEVITGVVIKSGSEEIAFADITEVNFHPISEEQIRFYVEKYKPFDKAGAYAIQEWIGVVGIKNIKGDFYNVMGLPVSRVVQALQQLGVL